MDDVSILATSQQALGVAGEVVVPVGPMALPEPTASTADAVGRSEAAALFCVRAEESNPRFRLTDETAPMVTQICIHLDGIPLAIELAAARAHVLPPAEIVRRLQDRFRLLNLGRATAPLRHQTLQAALDWSYDLLSPAEAAMLRRLSVFAGGATLAAVEEVCSGGEVVRTEVLDLVSELVSRSLVVADTSGPQARYRLLESIRDYGRKRLEEAAELRSQQSRHATWCLELAELAEPKMVASDHLWQTTMETELDDCRAALEWTVSDRDLGACASR